MIKKIMPNAINHSAAGTAAPPRETAEGSGRSTRAGSSKAKNNADRSGDPAAPGTGEGKPERGSFGEMLQSAQKEATGRPDAENSHSTESGHSAETSHSAESSHSAASGKAAERKAAGVNNDEAIPESETAPGAEYESGRSNTENERLKTALPTNGHSGEDAAGEEQAGEGNAENRKNESAEQKVTLPANGELSAAGGEEARQQQVTDGANPANQATGTPGASSVGEAMNGESKTPAGDPTTVKEAATGSGATATSGTIASAGTDAAEGDIPSAGATASPQSEAINSNAPAGQNQNVNPGAATANAENRAGAFPEKETPGTHSAVGSQQSPEEVKNIREQSDGSNRHSSGVVRNQEQSLTGKNRAPAENLGQKLFSDQRLKHHLSMKGAMASAESGQASGTNGDSEAAATRTATSNLLFKGGGTRPQEGQPVIQAIQAEQARKNTEKRRPFSFSGSEASAGSMEASPGSRENAPGIPGQQSRTFFTGNKPAGIFSAGTFPGNPEATPAMNFSSSEGNQEWELQAVELTEDSETTAGTGASGSGQVRLGDLPVNNLTIRKNILPGLTQTVSKAAGGAKAAPETWQKHNFVLEDGKEIHLSARRTEGVLQLKVGSLHGEINRLLQQHQHEIRQHLEQECNLEIDLQFENDDQQGLSDFFGDSSSTGSERSSPGISSGRRTTSQQAEQVTLKSVRRFGYNSNEWTA